MEKIAKYKNRIGAWVPAKAYHNIVENFINHHLITATASTTPTSSETETVAVIEPSEATTSTTIDTSAASLTDATTTSPTATSQTSSSSEKFNPANPNPDRIIIYSKTDDIMKLPAVLLMLQTLDVLVLKGLKPYKETLELMSSHIGPLDAVNNPKYAKFEYIVKKLEMSGQGPNIARID